jgi:probable HAF family extracellular repeat protein
VFYAVLWDEGKKIDLGTFGGDNSLAYAINDAGKVVGYSHTIGSSYRAVLWDKGKKIDLGTLGDKYENSKARAINKTGQVVGNSYTTSGSQSIQAVLWDKGSIKNLNNLIPPKSGWVLNEATDINDKGQIVGEGKINGQTHAFLLTPVK